MSDPKHFEAVAEAFDGSAADKYRRIWHQLSAPKRAKFDMTIFSAIKGNANIDTCLALWVGQVEREQATAARIERFRTGAQARHA